MVIKFTLNIAFLLGIVLAIQAQDEFVSIEVSSTNIEKGDLISIVIKSSGKGDLIYEFPDEFQQKGTHLSGMSSNVKVINGKSIIEQFSFLEYKGVFTKTGTFKFGPFQLQTSSGTLTSNSINIEVSKSINMISADPRDNLNQAIFGIIQQSKKEVFIGEPIVIEAKVYAQIDILQVDNFDPFTFEGPAQKVDLSNQSETKRNYEDIGGRQLMSFNMGRMVYYPELDGTFEISPFEMLLLYDDPRRLFPERARIRSNESMVKVKPLPENAPSEFNGAVGEYEIQVVVDRGEVEQGKVVAYTVEVKGKGNIEDFELPKINFPSGVMLYGDPEVEDSVFITTTGLSGKKRITYFLQLNKASDVNLEPLKLVYFNPNSEVYESKLSNAIHIKVEPNGDVVGIQLSADKEDLSNNQERRSFLPEKKKRSDSFNELFEGWTSTVWSYPIVLSFVIGFFWRVKKENKEKRKINKPSKLIGLNAFKALTKVESNPSISDEEFFQALKSVLDEFLVDKYKLNRLDITREFLNRNYSDLGFSSEDKDFILELFDYADSARFGLIGEAINQQKWLDRCHSLVQKLNDK